jgi:hypothetical protein
VSVFSARHLRWVVAMLLLAAAPIALVTLRPGRWDDCADPEALVDLGRVLEGTPGAEFQRFHRSHVFQREEGTLRAGPGLPPLRYRIVRTDEARYPFDQATRFLQTPMDPERREVRWVEAEGERLPVHLMYARQSGDLRVLASLFLYDGQGVESLFPRQLVSAPRQLLRGRRPLTLLQVHGSGPPPSRQRIEERAIAWLISAWQAYRGFCRP